MKALFYLLQVSACTGIFYLFYKAVLSRFTFFTLNRFYLLATLLASFIIPAITIPANAPQPLTVIDKPVVMEYFRPVERFPVPGPVPVRSVKSSFNWFALLPWIYFATTAILALHLVTLLTRILLRLRGNIVATINGVKIIKGDRRFKNGSFMNYIFLNDEALTKEELQQVLDHELTHIRLAHSADRILAQLIQVVLWFNPFSYWYSRAIVVNHEFEVDQQMAVSFNRSAYAELLIRLSVSPENSIYHHFSMIPLKKRIAMLFNKPTRNMKKTFYLLVLPLATVSGLAFANRSLNNLPAVAHTKKAVKTALKESADAFSRNLSVLAGTITEGTVPIPAVADSIATHAKHNELPAHELILSPESRPEVPGSAIVDTVTQPLVSAIAGADREYTGKSPLVIVDGKLFGSDILYSISRTCISKAGFFNVDWAVKEYGEKAKDGLVIIITKNGVISYMTENEREELIRKRAQQPLARPERNFIAQVVHTTGKITADAYGFAGPNGTAEKLLMMQKGIHIAADKTMYFNGNKVTSIMLNGKELPLTNSLANLPADTIRIIEITYNSNPGSAQTINLKTTTEN